MRERQVPPWHPLRPANLATTSRRPWGASGACARSWSRTRTSCRRAHLSGNRHCPG